MSNLTASQELIEQRFGVLLPVGYILAHNEVADFHGMMVVRLVYRDAERNRSVTLIFRPARPNRQRLLVITVAEPSGDSFALNDWIKTHAQVSGLLLGIEPGRFPSDFDYINSVADTFARAMTEGLAAVVQGDVWERVPLDWGKYK